MSLESKSKKLIRLIFFLSVGSFSAILILFWIRNSIWTELDYKVLDIVYRQSIEYGYGPKMSPQIVYIAITDDSYNYFGKNILDRADMARLNNALSEVGVESVAYDIIFARPSQLDSDQKFKSSIAKLRPVRVWLSSQLKI